MELCVVHTHLFALLLKPEESSVLAITNLIISLVTFFPVSAGASYLLIVEYHFLLLRFDDKSISPQTIVWFFSGLSRAICFSLAHFLLFLKATNYPLSNDNDHVKRSNNCKKTVIKKQTSFILVPHNTQCYVLVSSLSVQFELLSIKF